MRLQPASTSSVAVSPELDASYIKAADYWRPALGGLILGVVYFGIALIPFLFLSPWIYFTGVVSFSIPMLLLFVTSAALHHQLWNYRLRKYGTDAFEVFHDLEMPAEEAFELCLAATTQLKDSKIEKCDQCAGVIQVRVKGNFWITVDRLVEIAVQQVSGEKVRVKVASVIKLTPARTFLIEKAWGKKWQPLLFRTDAGKNRKIMDALLIYIQSIPDWDHKYLPGESFSAQSTSAEDCVA